METSQTVRRLHVRWDGQSLDLEQQQIDIGDISTDAQIKEAAAAHLNVPVSKFASYSVDRNPESGDFTLRPQATFG